ncbi:MAG TPA: hypothetical protein VIK51_20775, partial [Vicinamibacteria bacterium]
MDFRTSVLAVAGSALIAAASPRPVLADAAPVTHDLMPAPVRLEWQPGQLVIDRRFSLGSVGTADPRIEAALARARQRLETLGLTLAAAPAGAKATLVVESTGAGKGVQEVGEDESYELTVTP